MIEKLMICPETIENCKYAEVCKYKKPHNNLRCCFGGHWNHLSCPACIEYVEAINPNQIDPEVIKSMNKVYEDTTY
jgi:hypothetical protein